MSPPPMGSRTLHIGPGSLSPSERTRFHREFRPRIPKSLDTAARQIKATPKILPLTTKRTIGIAILVNTGDHNLPVDLMVRIAEYHAKAKWKFGRFSTLDTILCLSMDMLKNGQHPLHGRAIARDAADRQIAEGAYYLFDRWVRYGAAAVGASVQFTPGLMTADPLQLGGGDRRQDTTCLSHLTRETCLMDHVRVAWALPFFLPSGSPRRCCTQRESRLKASLSPDLFLGLTPALHDRWTGREKAKVEPDGNFCHNGCRRKCRWRP